MEIKEAKFILGNTAPFNKLNEKEIDEFLSICEIKKYKPAEVIYKDQDPPDYFYFLLRGRALALKEGSEIELLKRGISFGIISLFNDEPHSVTTKAIEETFVLKADKDKFKSFLNGHSLISLEFYRLLSQRIRAHSGKKKIFRCKRIAVLGPHLCGRSTYMFNLGIKLSEQTHKKIICVELSRSNNFKLKELCGSGGKVISLEDYLEETISDYIVKANQQRYSEGVVECLCVQMGDISSFPSLLNYLSENYHFVVYKIPDDLLGEDLYNIISPADYLHIIIFPDKQGVVDASCMIDFVKGADPLNAGKIKVIVNDFSAKTKLESNNIKDLLHSGIYATLPPLGEDYSRALRRISREVGEVLVGLALGSGGAYGFAHIGVLRILEENKIPIDMICGSSVGSVIAALWALGYDADHIEKFMIEFANKVNLFSFRGFSFPFKGLWRAKYLENILKKIFKDKTFCDLKHPLKIVVFDFLRKDAKVLEEGPLYKAVAASCALPGIFEPINFKGQVFLDGGVLIPLPTKILLNYGTNKIIAVNITPSQEEIMNEYNKRNKLHILDFIFGSIETMQRQFIEQAVIIADVVIHPNFGNLGWLEFERVKEFVKKGETATSNKLDEIKKIINI